ncbi:LytTR family transcriptional regulator [Paracrocinitomix mangrovi]|uniref:LytR/AlgR family response regulator transcription factor n=1 Tax=Paracrocinitomix mangrovi TaxID=2862509 RepID=UPI001C8EA55B|nr:LytTR family DNA-binding domain-containing protein [Paracrocinitomix mangrovi]UKN03620.1 LytTR family transcriptional regulator [Paracrocinitomix mangrovi]
MIKWLNKPYPFLLEERSTRLRVALFVFIFVFTFLAVFQPFEFKDVIGTNFYIACLAYGLTSAIVSFFFCSIITGFFPSFANEKTWTIGKEILMMNGILLSISFANLIVGYAVEFHSQQNCPFWQCMLDDIIHTYSIGVFPVMVINFTSYTVMLKRNLSKVEEHNVQLHDRKPVVYVEMPSNLVLTSPANNNDIEIDLSKLLYIMADGNYVEFYLEDAGDVKREIKRNTLNNIVAQLEDYDFLFRSHRAYIVNLNRVVESTGNAQGYQLKLDIGDFTVPVSRTKLREFDNILKSKQNLLEQYSA